MDSNKKKKVILFLDYFYIGGIEKIIENIYSNLKEDYNLEILSFVSKDKKVKKLLKKEHNSFFLRNLLGLIKFKKYLKSNKCDIIHINCYNSFGLIYGNIAKKYVKKVIIHAHNSSLDNDFLNIKKYINIFIKTIFESNNCTLISVSDESAKFCFGDKIYQVIYNAIDYNKYKFNINKRKEYRKKFNISDEKIVIGNIGRFVPQKNHSFLIDIFNELYKMNNNYYLIMVGEGILYNQLKLKIKSLGLEKNIKIFKYRKDIPDFINIFDIYLFPSIYEGFPLTLIENQINGTEIFASTNITKIVKISNRLHFISLDKEPSFWAKEIINYKDKKLILKNDLNIENFINKIKKIYESE